MCLNVLNKHSATGRLAGLVLFSLADFGSYNVDVSERS